MSGPSHDPDELISAVAGFAERETRQVWARYRVTDEPVFLPDGQAVELRATVKADWKCPVPGCLVPITSVGPASKRHHWRHVGAAPHASAPESENHLGAKAMLADWAVRKTRHASEPVTVVEEGSVKDPATAVNRRADVMVTANDGRQVALEVEYKAFAIADWRRKQGDYDTKKIVATWLLGHTRVSIDLTAPSMEQRGRVWWPVRIPELALACGKRGLPVLVINPTSTLIGTVRSSPFLPDHPTWDTSAWITFDQLDDFALTPNEGMTTPAFTESCEQVAQEEKAAEARQARFDDRAAKVQAAHSDSARHIARAAAERERREAEHHHRSRLWQESDIRESVTNRWGRFSTLLATGAETDAIHVLRKHWQTVLHEELIDDHEPGYRFTLPDCYRALERHGIRHDGKHPRVGAAIREFFDALTHAGVLKASGPYAWETTGYTVLDYDRDVREREEQEAQRRAAARAAFMTTDRLRE